MAPCLRDASAHEDRDDATARSQPTAKRPRPSKAAPVAEEARLWPAPARRGALPARRHHPEAVGEHVPLRPTPPVSVHQEPMPCYACKTAHVLRPPGQPQGWSFFVLKPSKDA